MAKGRRSPPAQVESSVPSLTSPGQDRFAELLEEYRLLAENASDVVFRTSADYTLLWVSPSVFQLMGYQPHDVVGQNLVDFLHADEIEPLMEFITSSEPGAGASTEIRVRNSRGDYQFVSIFGRGIYDENGVNTGYIGGVRDTEAEHASRVALAESESRYRLLAENSSDVVSVASSDGVLQWISESVESLLGWQPPQLVGLAFVELVHPDDRSTTDAVQRHLSEGRAERIETRLRTSHGTYRWVSIVVREVDDPIRGARTRIASWRDVQSEVENRFALAESERRYRLLAENASDIVCQFDALGHVDWVSPSVSSVLGWHPEDLFGMPLEELVDVELRDTFRAELDRVLSGQTLHTIETRLRTSDGGFRWMSISAQPLHNSAGDVTAVVSGFRDVSDEVLARQTLAESEGRYRLLAEHASDIVIQTDGDGVVQWISPSIEQVLGWHPEDIVGTESIELVAPDDLSMARARRALIQSGGKVDAHEKRYLTITGETVWMSVHPQPIIDDHGDVSTVVIALRNCQAEVLARRALMTLSAGNRALVRAEHELELLHQMCEVAVADGGYAFAWYGRRVDDTRRTVAKVAMSDLHREYLDEVDVTWGDDPLGAGPAGRAIRLGQTIVTRDHRVEAAFQPWLDAANRHGLRSSVSLPVRIDSSMDGAFLVYATEPDAFDESAVHTLEDLAAELGYGLKRLRDRALLAQSLSDQALLTSAIDQAGESIVVTDPASTIIYANPAAARNSGYSLNEVLGQNPRIFQSGVHSREFYEQMWSTLQRGETWRGVLTNRRKNGDEFEEEATISPIHDADGALVAYVGVKHDLTVERRLRADLDREQQDHQAIVSVMREIRQSDSLYATADAFCEAATRLSDIDVACVLLLENHGSMLPIAISGSDLFDIGNAPWLFVAAPERIQEIIDGPVQVSMDEADWPVNPGVLRAAVEDGMRAIVFAPIRWEGRLIAVLALATKDPQVAETVRNRFDYFEELGSYAGSLFGAQVNTFVRQSSLRAELGDIIDQRRFHPVFQPFVNLATGDVVGYEALTRFDDDRPVDQHFIDAHDVDLASQLEAACAAAALEATRDLDPGLFLSVNFSPNTLLDGTAAATLANAQRRIIIEVTEHARIDDYAGVREAVRSIPGCSLAVDDAGAGYTSLSHILELQPQYVKLDISIVRNIDSNRPRQAMAAGMCHFAAQSGTVIIAEGVETQAEADVLRDLGVTLGQGGILAQGYFFGLPTTL